uniref:zinc finger protein 239-like n=1 Tax=Styela clava TaxID=7725 RepID=UPI001939EE49|nr:zinc finger protein 239-like [Styela clava]
MIREETKDSSNSKSLTSLGLEIICDSGFDNISSSEEAMTNATTVGTSLYPIYLMAGQSTLDNSLNLSQVESRIEVNSALTPRFNEDLKQNCDAVVSETESSENSTSIEHSVRNAKLQQKASINGVCERLLSAATSNDDNFQTTLEIQPSNTQSFSNLLHNPYNLFQNELSANKTVVNSDSSEVVRYPSSICTYKSPSKLFTCSFCKKSFTQSGTLKRHTRIHTGYKPYKCSSCDKTFSLKSYLVTHKRTHTGEKPYQCLTCGKCFSQPSSLKTHTQTHSNVKPYECDTCGFKFALKSYLTVHERTHTGEKPYKCGECGKTFTQGSSLNVHLRKHVTEFVEPVGTS